MTVTRFEILPDRSRVWIEGSSSIHPIRASATGLTGWAELADSGVLSAGLVEIELERLSSGNPLVDRETRRRVNARRHPTIRGTVTAVTGDKSAPSVVGRIEFRGESCDVEGDLSIRPHDDAISIEGKQLFDVRDWGLKPPRLGLLKVNPEVEVRIHVEAAREN